MTSAIVTALVLDVLLLMLVRVVQLLAGGGPRLVTAGRKPNAAPGWNDQLDRLALVLSLLAGVLLLAWLLLG